MLLPAVRQLEMLRSRNLSVAELAEAHIRQIEHLNPQLNAFVDFDPNRVRAQAHAMDATPLDSRGPLHGLPVSVKSSISVPDTSARLEACSIKTKFLTRTPS